MRDVMVVTNRSPFSYIMNEKTKHQNSGGVATAIDSMLRSNGGKWICWGDGKYDDMHPVEDVSGYRVIRIFLTKPEVLGFYINYSNRVLWPLFHYFRNNIAFNTGGFKYYYSVNQKFAEKIKENITDNTVIWIHDYQLMMVPGILRKLGVKNKIIFTWHIPWVSPEFFNILPESDILLNSLAKSDLITFHINKYRLNFRGSLVNLKAENRTIKTAVFPLGIDNKRYRQNNYVNGTQKLRIIFSIDRMDYTKGLLQRVRAIENLMRIRHDLRGKFIYLMHVTPSRAGIPEYIEMKKTLEMEIGRINGIYSTSSWIPIIYMYRNISEKLLDELYMKSDIGLITPLIDGLNLVAKEFISATDHGVLILSKFAGVSEELKDAIIVNPNNIGEVTNAIINALQMTEDEIKIRLNRMKQVVSKKNSTWWYRSILNKINTV